MTKRDPEAVPGRIVVDHAPRFVKRTSGGGGFTIEVVGRSPVLVEPCGHGWRVEGVKSLAGWLLRRESGRDGGFVLQDPDGTVEAARTMPPVGMAGVPGPRFLLLENGQLFRMVLRGPRDGGFELSGWETPGSYLVARPAADGWNLVPQPACGGLADIQVLSLMFAAELLDAEDPLETGMA